MGKAKKEQVSALLHIASDTDGIAGKLSLKREVGLIGAISLNAGLIISSGIFMSPGASLLILAICGVISMLGALSFVELGTYCCIVSEFSPVFCITINCLNVKFATCIQIVFTSFKLLSLLTIVRGGVVLPVGGHTTNFQNAFEGTKAVFGPVALAFCQGFWSYDGWNNLNYITEEIKQPEVSMRINILRSTKPRFFLFLLDILSMTHIDRLTPSASLIFTAFISLIMLIPRDFLNIINYVRFVHHFDFLVLYQWHVGSLLSLKLLFFAPLQVPILIPIVMLLVAVGLVVVLLINSPQVKHLYVSAFILSGLLIYVPFIHFKLGAGLASNLTVFLQLLLDVSPTHTSLD
uniref:Zmp:0000001267 n=1 Tax=Callorhinchus milii TaxID=7868 RepID=A0A4W3JBJ5_CALMI